ncbi:EscU/YscU/HrcU family type III secretion system export apparatus switch protein [Novosphingobium cyanobacteriorum]|uniref:Flagellar type III secretion system protein FlhB n=1 Tax=Novosphingobium cyanobacteriorum TaxID=3024215 RepID=A0ABT6CM39_9SPHN|nr:flagellar type III secretion system protein FlhB [Novosphingobium cyanobacteriorum]MDF8334293.1 flagellar type III secretion system protein FlhB [Novosphingobium cyanobacteriorum]
MAEETSGEKTFAPTEKRRKDAAKNGDVLRSKDLATAVGVLTGAVWLKFAGPWTLGLIAGVARAGMTFDRSGIEHFAPQQAMMLALVALLPPVLVLGGMIMFTGVVSQLGFSDGRWLPSNLAPKAHRINPASGLKRMFGPQGWIELAKGLAKLALLGLIAWVWIKGRVTGLVGIGAGNLHSQLTYGWDALISLLFALGAGLTIIALVDFPIQWVRRYLRLQMSLQEIKDEQKEAEGSPERKGMIRNRQRQIAMGGMQKAMREAQFVVTNPTHFSVAMAYDPEKASAPIVLAKGRGDKALAMRELAAELKVPTLEFPALARSVYYTTRENQVIREELYAPVAAVLAFVLSLKRGETPPTPRIEVPIELRFDTEGRPERLQKS